MTLDLNGIAGRWAASGLPAMVVEVLRTKGSAPRDAGTRMLVSADLVHGTIGGGHLEAAAIDLARQLLAQGGAPHEQSFALGPALGQCCGGKVALRWRPLAECNPAAWPAPEARFFLQLYGAGHVGRAIAALLATLACRVQWIDERESEFPPGPSPRHIERICVDAVEAEVRHAPPRAAYLVMTHSHELDLAITQAILQRGDFGFAGLIGSASKRTRFEHRLRERGIAPERLERLVCPIGVPGIEGKEPEVIAIAAVAQLLQAMRGAAAPG